MNDPSRSRPIMFSRQFDDLRAQFEAAWEQGQEPRVEVYLGDRPEPQRSALLRTLLQQELDLLRGEKSVPIPEDYRKRFPDDIPVVDEVFSLFTGQKKSAEASIDSETKNPARVVMEVISGPHKGSRFEFDRHQTFLAGRSSKAHLRLQKDDFFSRNHFRVEIQPPTGYLIDLGSRNGTLVNGNRLQEAFLKDGDVISGGHTKIRFSIPQHSETNVVDPLSDSTQIGLGSSEEEEGDTKVHIILPQKQLFPQSRDYDFGEEIGRGVTGVAYRAVQKSTKKNVVVKVISPAIETSESSRQFFLREVTAIQELIHPCVLPIKEIKTDREQILLVMDEIETVDLQLMLREESMESGVRLVCTILCELLDTLSFAHTNSLVHRDIKPSNVLVSAKETGLDLKLSDLSLTNAYYEAGFGDITRDGETRNSLAYVPPEQIVDCRSADPAGDIYAAGATLYEFLSGEVPFDFSSDRNYFAMVLEDDPVPLLCRRADLPRRLIEIVQRAMAKDVNDRFPTADAMRQALLPFTWSL